MSATKQRNSGLGKGLAALLQNANDEKTTSEYGSVGSITNIPIEKIEANPFQPRTEFSEKELKELANSIENHGVIQPITVRQTGRGKFQIISGERRTRASILAGFTTIPAYVRIARDQEMLEMAIVENLHRENLNPLEIAQSYARLIEECDLKQDELSDRVNKDRSTISNYLRLLKLPEEIQNALKSKIITMGHAKAILSLDDLADQITLLRRITDENLSVRKTEELAKGIHNIVVQEPIEDVEKTEKLDVKGYQHFQLALAKKFGVNVSLKSAKHGGLLQFNFEDIAQLEKLLARLA